MKLYLSSYQFGDEKEKLSLMRESNNKAVVITNALDFSTDYERRTKSEDDQINQLKDLGYNGEILDLRTYFGKESLLKSKLEEQGLIWVHGGNSFLLRSAMAQSGFDTILKEFGVREDKRNFIYGGFSAGICVLAPTLKGIDLMDDPDIVKEIYNTQTIWDGINILNYSIVPHYRSEHKETDVAEKAVNYFTKNNLPYKALRDGEVIIENTLLYEGKVKNL